MNTTENNKIIARFMGLTIITDNISYFDTSYKPLKKYNEDWNWLMEVVEKIESLNVVVEIRENVCYIETTPQNYTSELEPTKIQATYKACLAFIKWYNEQRNQVIQDSIDVDSWSK